MPAAMAPMPARRFWNLIGAMGGRADEDAVARLRGALKLLPRRDVVAFQERLARVLYELDREVLARQPVRFADDHIETAVSYETRSNQKHWTPPPEPGPEPWGDDRMPVSVLCHDLSNPINAMLPDRMLYPPPPYLGFDELLRWGPTLARIVAVNGGVRADLGVDQVGIHLDFDGAWRTEPEVGERYDDVEFHIGRVLPVRVTVADADARAWPTDVLAEVVMALAAACLLAVLPTAHAARPDIQAVYDRGARHLP